MKQSPEARAKAILELRRRQAPPDAPIEERAPFSDPVQFIETQFYIPERRHQQGADRAMGLQPYQRAVLREAYRTDPETGKFIYDVIVWSDIKKSIKSCIAAGVILHRALETSWGSFKVVANDLRQANSRVFFYIQRALLLNPDLGQRAKMHNYKISFDNHSIIEAVPVDPAGEAGGNDDFIEWTELHAARTKAATEMWAEMTISPTKHGYAQRWIDTYAGHEGEAPILESLYEQGVKNGQRLELDGAPDDLEVYANGRLLVMWNTEPRHPFQTQDYYASEAATLPDKEYRRMHGNQWVTSQDAFVPIAWWDACKVDMPDRRRDQLLIVGLDAAVDGDCFAIVAVSKTGDTIEARYARQWTPPLNGAILYSNPLDPLDPNTPEGVVRALAQAYPVAEFAYDPYQLHDFCSRLRIEGVGHFREFKQGPDRLIADKQLYDQIKERHLQWSASGDGMDDLRQHIQNANQKADGGKLRIVKRHDHGYPIDLTVALSMAARRASFLNIG